MRTRFIFLTVFIVGSVAIAQPVARPSGYLAPGEFDVTPVIEPAPRKGDPRYETDRKIFKATRKLVGTPRYQLATSDVQLTPAAMLRNFSCAVGVNLTPENAPRLITVIQRSTIDTGGQSGRAKDFYKRERPYVIDKGPVCQAPTELYDQRLKRASYDYPSGHTTLGWTYALVLASVAPDRAQAILERGRAYGDSRFICGAHNESAVEAGMLATSATMALVATKAAYQDDLAGARGEVAALRASGAIGPSGCEAEQALVRQRVMPKLGH